MRLLIPDSNNEFVPAIFGWFNSNNSRIASLLLVASIVILLASTVRLAVVPVIAVVSIARAPRLRTTVTAAGPTLLVIPVVGAYVTTWGRWLTRSCLWIVMSR